MNFEIRYWTRGQETEKLRQLFVQHWHDDTIVAHGTIFRPEDLEAFVVINNNDIKGLLTFVVKENDLEIVTLDSFVERQGIGSRLLEAVEKEAVQRNRQRLWLVTTNDNLNALGFYQCRGFQLVSVAPNAVDEARKLKPSIPLIADKGIPIRDELLLEKKLSLLQSQGDGSA